MQLHLIRHPQPLVAPDTCYGSTDLACAAPETARACAALKGRLPDGVTLYSSPLQRCAALAQSLAMGPPVYDARLVEMAFGSWEMRRWPDIARAEIDAWADDLLHYRPGGGENLLQAAERVREFYNALRWSREASAIVICHAGTIRLLQACASGLPITEMALTAARQPHKIGYGELITLNF